MMLLEEYLAVGSFPKDLYVLYPAVMKDTLQKGE